MSLVEEKELIAYAIEPIKSLFPGLSSRPVPPLPKSIKVDLSRVIGTLIEHVESVLAGCTEPWTTDMVWNADVIPSLPSELDSATRRGEETTVSDALIPLQRYVAAHIHTHSGAEIRYLTYVRI